MKTHKKIPSLGEGTILSGSRVGICSVFGLDCLGSSIGLGLSGYSDSNGLQRILGILAFKG